MMKPFDLTKIVYVDWKVSYSEFPNPKIVSLIQIVIVLAVGYVAEREIFLLDS